MKIKNIVVSILLVLAVPIFPSASLQAADPPGWKDLGLYGGQMYAVAIDPVDPETMFAGSYQGDGLFKSTDSGVTWESVNGFRNLTVYSIAIDPTNHSTVWVVTTGYVYKTDDGGTTWRRMDPGSQSGLYFYCSVTVDYAERNTVYVGTSGLDGRSDDARIFKTTDGGNTWQELSLVADHDVWGLAINPGNPQEVWAITGPTWVSTGSIYRTRNGGTTWSTITTGTNNGWFWSIVINPQEPTIVYVTGEKGILRTKDGGATWSQLEPSGWCRGIALDPQNPGIMYVNCLSDDDTIFAKSTDGGDSWIYHRGFPLEFLCLSVSPQSSETVFGGESTLGVFRTTDGGETWGRASNGIRANRIMDSAVSPSGTLLVGSYSGVHLKRQGGEWELLKLTPGRSVAFSPNNENTIYAGFDYGFGKSIDSGENWAVVYIPSNDPNRVSSIAINPQNPDIVYLGVAFSNGTRGEIYKSTDGGLTILPVKTLDVPVNVVKINPVNPQVVYAGSGMFFAPGAPGAIYKSTDGGETWAIIRSDLVVNALALDSSNPDIVYAACGTTAGFYGGLFKSTDGGTTWQESDFGIPIDSGIPDMGIDPTNRNFIYVASARHGLFISPDGGNYWTVLGLSDYWLYDVTVGSPPNTGRGGKKASTRVSLPSSGLNSGSGSGMLEFTGSGIGVVTGSLRDTLGGFGINGGTLSTDTGGAALSLNGYYLMVTPAGQCTVTGSMDGYRSNSKTGVVVTSGGETPLDLSLNPPCCLALTSLKTNLMSPPATGQDVQITFTASGTENPLSYQYWQASGYQTSNYGNWLLLNDWSGQNALQWTPLATNHYVLVAHLAADPTSGAYHQAGLSIETQGNSANPILIQELTTTMGYPQASGTPITLTTAATGGNGPLQYKYWYCKGIGGTWNIIRDYSTASTCSWTPAEKGLYTVVVWVTDDTSVSEPPIAGMTCTIGE